jgi:DNA replicative helicase MCM subunit Mcm2 (Cdc46/Mcm family)
MDKTVIPLKIDEGKKDKKPKETETKLDGKKKDDEEIENSVLKIIKDIEGDEGALWDSITDKCKKTGLDKDSIEEALTSLMDKGLIYEPILGTIKTT